MPHSRTCPVCLTPNAIIRPDAKTCSRECSRFWNKMPRSEQQARMDSVNPLTQEEKLHKSTFTVVDEIVNEDGTNEAEEEDINSLPPGILPGFKR